MTYDATAACEGKKVYETMRHAKQDARRMRQHLGEVFVPYRCPHCRRIHVGRRA